ncbi:pre-mRNA-splicing factor CWC22 [Schistosoma bovis]|uniref:Pre-mRNA-splicing factor CWC22 n=1 Tax=Schistosoma bovis TaxID=6184 RepID=A0A430Q9F5_SCHBO|nr:pre-mRNA-splicing factor CWC22 [Schistosoma bovis]
MDRGTKRARYSPENEKSSAVSENPKKDDSSKNPDKFANIFGKTGGAYIPPGRLRQMQAQITDKSSEAYQRIAWEALKKSIHGFINKVNVSNLSEVVKQLLMENIVRAFRRNQKDRCLSTARFLAHLVNQKVVHELIILELLTLLLEQTTDDSVEVAVSVLKECGAMLSRLVPKGVHGIFEHLRRILNEGQCDKRISYMLEVMFQIRRDGWKDHPIVLPELDLIQESDQITHTTSLLDQVDPEEHLNVFKFDPEFLANEAKYAEIRAALFESNEDSEAESDGENEGEDSDESGDEDDDGDEEDEEHKRSAAATAENQQTIIDQTETNLVHLRRTIYLMLQSSLSADEAGHRLLQLKIKPGEEYEVASMVLDCCAQTRSYESRYGRLAQRLCRVVFPSSTPSSTGSTTVSVSSDLGPGSRYRSNKEISKPTAKEETPAPVVEESGPPRSYVAQFEKIFSEQYSIIHRLETAKLRNVAFLFAHLLYSDSISWGVFECVRLNERDTTSSGRIFLKHLFLELCSFMGLSKLQARLRDETLQPFFAGLLPRDNPKDTRFAINFLTTIGLGGLTLDLREHLQASRDSALAKKESESKNKLSSSVLGDISISSSSSSSSSSSGDSSSGSESESSCSNDEKHRKKRKHSKDKHKLQKKSHSNRHHDEHHQQHKSYKHTSSKHSEMPSDRISKHSDSTHKNDKRSRLKTRPVDTPFFNDTPNSPAHSRQIKMRVK